MVHMNLQWYESCKPNIYTFAITSVIISFKLKYDYFISVCTVLGKDRTPLSETQQPSSIFHLSPLVIGL